MINSPVLVSSTHVVVTPQYLTGSTPLSTQFDSMTTSAEDLNFLIIRAGQFEGTLDEVYMFKPFRSHG